MKQRKTCGRAGRILLCLLLALVLALPAAAYDTNVYSETDVNAVNAMIDGNGLSATKDDPASWGFATWSDDDVTPKRITALDLEGRSLTGEVDVSALTALTDLNLRNNAVTAVTGLDRLTGLTGLNLGSNQISAVDVSTLTDLRHLNVERNQLTALDVRTNTGLKWLYCGENQLTALDVSPNTALLDLHCQDNDLTALDLTHNALLQTLRCQSNWLASLDVSACTELTELYARRNALTGMDVSHNTNLKDFECGDNLLTALDVSGLTALERLACQGNQISSLDLSDNTALRILVALDNEFSSLDLSGLSELEILYCGNNPLSGLDLSKNTQLAYLYCQNSGLTALDLSNNPNLEVLDCERGNPTGTLDLSHQTSDTFIYFGNDLAENATFSADGKSVLQIGCPKGDEDFDIENWDDQGNLTLVIHNNDFQSWEITPALAGVDLTDSSISLTIPSGYTTLNPIRSGTTPQPTAPVITTGSLPEAAVNTAYSVQLTATGTAPITFTASNLPAWLTLSESGLLSGTPAAPGSSTFTVTASNAAGSVQKEFTLTVAEAPAQPTAPVITTGSLPTATVNTAYSVQLTATGTAPITFTASNLPAWLTLSESGLLSGTPAAQGSSTFTVTASNTAGSVQKEFTLTVQQSSGGGSSGGGSSSSGSSGGSTAPAPEVNTGDGQSTAVIAPKPTVSGGSTNVTLTTGTIRSGIAAAEQAAEQAGTQGVVEIRVETEGTTDIKATLPTSSLEDIAKSDADTLRLTGPIGTVELDGAALSAIAEEARGTQVSLEIDAVAPESLNAAQRELVGDRPVYNFSVTSLGLEIHNFSGGTAAVTLPYTLKEGENPQDIVIYYLFERGGPDGPRQTVLERMHTVYDPESGTVRFLTNHLSLYAVGSWSNPFADVDDGAWYYEDVAFTAVNSLMEGTAADAFSPDGTVTRATAATLLYRLAGEPAVDSEAAFTDVPDGAWYADAVRWAAANGIAQGVGTDRFDPDAPVTRQDLAVFLTRYLAYEGIDFPLTLEYVTFSDHEEIADYADEALQTLYKLGVIQGVGGDQIDPLGQSTRAQAAAMLHRLLTASQVTAG